MQLTKRAPIGVENFGELVDPEQNYVFVDRSPLIKQIFDDGAKVVAFHTFRRGGKSLLASMLECFFASKAAGKTTAGMFDNLQINKTDPEFVAKCQGKYPVVKVSLKGVQESTFEEALEGITLVVQEAYAAHAYLKNSDLLDEDEKRDYSFYKSHDSSVKIKTPLAKLENALKKLTSLLFKHHGKKVIVVIDEYDAPLTSAVRNDHLDPMALFMKNLFSNVFKTNDYLEKGILIGILRVSKESLLSGLNNIKVCTLLKTHGYQPYLGFTEQEVKDLFKQCDISVDMNVVKYWYDGYLIGGQSLYNPWAIISYIDELLQDINNPPDAYWVATSNDNLLRDSLLAMPSEVKDQFRQLIVSNEPVEISFSEVVSLEDVKKDPTALWGLLYGAGYITASAPLTSSYPYYTGLVRIPNQEIKKVYVGIFSHWLHQQLHTYKPSSLFHSLCQGDVNTFGKLIGEYLLKHTSHRNLKSEACYHNLMLGLSAGLLDSHHVFSDNIESGLGYPDMMIIPKTKDIAHLAIVLEFKRAPANIKESTAKIIAAQTLAAEALAQIETRQYLAALAGFPHVTRVLKVGMGFLGKEVVWETAEEHLA